MYIIILLAIIIVILNETSLFHKESEDYSKIPEREPFCREAAPFEIKNGSDRLIIFVHGYPSTPAVYRWAADEVAGDGWDAAAPLLPGFGTGWKDLLSTNFSMWYAYLKDYYIERRRKYKTVAVVGTSMGGALTLKLAEEFSSDKDLAPDAIVTVAAPVFINRVFCSGILKNPGYYLVRSVGWFTKSIRPRIVDSPGDKDIDGRGRWRGYSGIFPRQVYSLKLGLKRIKADLKKVTVPYLIFHDRKDRTVPFENSLYIAKRCGTKNLELTVTDIGDINHEHHSLLIYDSTRKMVLNRIEDFLNRI